MTITMTGKNQITIPKRIANVLDLKKGAMFNVELHRHRIELIPVEVKEKVLTAEQYRKLDILSKAEKGKEKPVTKKYVSHLRKGHL